MKGLKENIKKYYQMQRGKQLAQATIEYALALPVLLILILGGVDLGRMFYTKMVLTNAVTFHGAVAATAAHLNPHTLLTCVGSSAADISNSRSRPSVLL